MYNEVFSTDYWLGGMGGEAGASVQAQPPNASGSFVLPALWWLGGVIALVLIRLAYEFMD